MLEFIHGLCESNNLAVHDFNSNIEGLNAKFSIPNNKNNNQEYYLILEYNIADDSSIEELVKEHIEILMDTLEKLDITDESFRKNCTLILCCKTGQVSDQSLLRFEENPYFFKKNVITYSELELSALKKILNNKYNNKSLNQLLMSNGGELFESFKTLVLEDGNYYPLLIRVMTKIPFVHYIPQNNKLEDLELFIETELDALDLKLLNIICNGDKKLNSELIEVIISSSWGEI